MRESKRGIGPCRIARAVEWILLIAVTLVLHTVPAHAAGRAAKERQAREACLSGDYQKGVSILSRLFVLTENPVHIHNQGRCFEQNRRYEDAIARFQEFLRVLKNRYPGAQEEARKHIAECEASLNQATVLRNTTPAPPPAPAETPKPTPDLPAATAAPPPAPAAVPVVAERASESVPTSGSALRTAGLITAAVGGAALVAGLLLNLKVNSMSDELEQKNKYSEARDSSRKTYRTMSAISYGVGAACVATGAVLYLLGYKSQADSPTVAFAPALATGRFGVAMEGRF